MRYHMPVEHIEYYRHLTGDYPYPAEDDPLVEMARLYLDGGDITSSARAQFLAKTDRPALIDVDITRFKRRLSMPYDKWASVWATRVMNTVEYGTPVSWKWCVFDGGHRIAMALALGHEKIRVEEMPVIKCVGPHIYNHPRPYQTLVFPGGIHTGVRGLERWPLFRKEDIERHAIVDIGCSSGTDGILACLAGARSYRGVEQDVQAIEYGLEMQRQWGLHQFAIYPVALADTLFTLPYVHTLFMFSVARRIPRDDLIKAVDRIKPLVTYCETHCIDDEPTLSLMGQLRYNWEEVGRVPASIGSASQRIMYRGERNDLS